MEWSDIRVFLQVVREGTMAAATSALRMDHSTISRRIARLEEETGVSLFERAGRRLALTAEGDKLVLAAERLESIIIRDVMSLSGDREHITGQVRIGATEEFGAHYLAWRLAELTASHPGLEIELMALPRTFSLAAREVDVLVTLDRPLTGDVRFKKLIDFQLGVYGSAAYFGGRRRPTKMEELAVETWCGYIQELFSTSELELLSSATDALSTKFRTANVTVQLAAALSGSALAALPCFVATAHPALERVLPDDAVFERTYWLAVHQDLAKHPRVRAVMNAIEAQVGRDRVLFMPTPMVARGTLEQAVGPLH
jgi:DNA-binding transcriptional LysR family regulator